MEGDRRGVVDGARGGGGGVGFDFAIEGRDCSPGFIGWW